MVKKRIKELRLSRNLKQFELSELMGVDRHQISSYEIGRRSPSHSGILKLDKALNLTDSELVYLIRGNNDKEKT